jgi:hypothetical protein
MLTDGVTGFFSLAILYIRFKMTYAVGGMENADGVYIHVQNVDYDGICALKVDIDYAGYSCLSKYVGLCILEINIDYVGIRKIK